jgi:hypothetical protein
MPILLGICLENGPVPQSSGLRWAAHPQSRGLCYIYIGRGAAAGMGICLENSSHKL